MCLDKVLKPMLLLVLKPTQQFLLDTYSKPLVGNKPINCRIINVLRLSVITKISYSYCDINIQRMSGFDAGKGGRTRGQRRLKPVFRIYSMHKHFALY